MDNEGIHSDVVIFWDFYPPFFFGKIFETWDLQQKERN